MNVRHKKQNTELIILSLVAILAIIGLALLFQTSATGKVTRVVYMPSGVYATPGYNGGCWKQCLALYSYGSTAFAECNTQCLQQGFTGGGRHG